MQRPYSGTVGRIENSKVGVFLAFAGCWDGLLDPELNPPRGRAGDANRREGTPRRMSRSPPSRNWPRSCSAVVKGRVKAAAAGPPPGGTN